LLVGSSCTSDPTPVPTKPSDNGSDDEDDQGTGKTDDDADDDGASDGDDDSTVKKDAGTGSTKPKDAGKPTASTDAGKPGATSMKDASTEQGPETPASTDGGNGSSNTSDDAGGSTPEPQSCAGKPNMWKAGDTNLSIMVGGQKRTFILHVPASYKGDTPVPLLLDFHPMIFGTAASQRRSSGYAEIADKEGFIVAYADGIDNAWNLGPCCTKSRDVDDFGLALALVERFKTEGCIDNKRVYAAGYSNGGGLSHYLACKSADVFAATSPAAFDLIEEVKCEPSRPISVVIFRGTADNIVPYAGGASTPPTPYPLDPIHFLGAQGTFKKWAEIDGCTGEPTAGSGGCKTYTQCKDGVEVTLCTAQGGGHVTGDAKVAWPMLKKFTLP
jgi:poly(3-hydroxybutyrate) depolymerase